MTGILLTEKGADRTARVRSLVGSAHPILMLFKNVILCVEMALLLETKHVTKDQFYMVVTQFAQEFKQGGPAPGAPVYQPQSAHLSAEWSSCRR